MASITAPRPAHHAPRGFYREASHAGAPIRRTTRAQVRFRRTVAVLLLATAALAAVFVLGRSTAHSAGNVAGQVPVQATVYTVQPGDTLWSIATRVAPKADPRSTIHQLRDLNSLKSGMVQVGQKLTIPN